MDKIPPSLPTWGLDIKYKCGEGCWNGNINILIKNHHSNIATHHKNLYKKTDLPPLLTYDEGHILTQIPVFLFHTIQPKGTYSIFSPLPLKFLLQNDN